MSSSKSNRSVETVSFEDSDVSKRQEQQGSSKQQQLQQPLDASKRQEQQGSSQQQQLQQPLSQQHQDPDAVPIEPYAEIAKAVQNQLIRNKEAMLKEVTERADQQIEIAVKRALEAHEQQSSSKKAKKEPELKRDGNKMRYKVNEEILEKVEDAINAIDRKDLEAAKTSLEGGKKILNKQQKLICLADREENGWTVVRHYLSDDLASDSDDEKAINKARRDALATIKKKQTKRREKFRNAPQRNRMLNSNYNSTNKREYEYKPRYETRNYDRKTPRCYRCGNSGHLQSAYQLKFERRWTVRRSRL